MRRTSLASHFGEGEALINDPRHGHVESIAVVDFQFLGCTVVVPKGLFVKITKQMERLDSNVSAFQPALEKAPEIFQAVCVYATFGVSLRMVYDLMLEFLVQPDVGHEGISINRTALFDVLREMALQCTLLSIRHGEYADF